MQGQQHHHPVRIFYDGLAFENLAQRGIQRYFNEIIAHLGSEYEASMWIGRRIYALPPKACRTTVWPLGSRFRKRARALHWLFARKPDVYHSTFFTLPPFGGGYAIVQTLHDMIPEVLQDQLGGWWRAEMETKRQSMEGSHLVICISHATAADLRRIHPQLDSKIRVIHHGADHLLRNDAAARTAGGERYVVVVGDRGTYKNFKVVLEALSGKAWPAGLKLKVIGPAFKEAEQQAVSQSGRGGEVEHLGRLSDADLQATMRGAVGVIYPSLMEGFGFPVLEAQAARTLILCSDIPVFREIGGQGAMYFDPSSAEALGAALAASLDDAKRRASIEAGWENVKRFTWEKCVRETLGVYKEAMALSQSGNSGVQEQLKVQER